MKISIVFKDVPLEVRNAIANVRVEDQSQMDAPATRITTESIGPFTIKPGDSTVLFELQVPVVDRELSLVVRVSGLSVEGKKMYMNTSIIHLPRDSENRIKVDVFEIG